MMRQGLFNLPARLGTYYEAEVPDTLDLAERARLGLNHYTESIREELDYEMVMSGNFGGDGSEFTDAFRLTVGIAFHMTGIACCQAKCMESMAMLRMVSGSQQHLESEGKMAEMMNSHVGEDSIVEESELLSAFGGCPKPQASHGWEQRN